MCVLILWEYEKLQVADNFMHQGSEQSAKNWEGVHWKIPSLSVVGRL